MQETLFDIVELPIGITLLKNFIEAAEQESMVEQCRQIAKVSPLVNATTRSGHQFSVAMTSVGKYGWFSDKTTGYHYRTNHPMTKRAWEKMPRTFYKAAKKAAEEIDWIFKPDTCLINYYRKNSKLNLHIDDSEDDLTSPIVTFSLGASCTFAIGGLLRNDPVQRITLNSGDVLIMHRDSRMRFHGVDKLLPGTSKLLKDDARISLTFRKHKIG